MVKHQKVSKYYDNDCGQVNSVLREGVTSLERQYWSNSQYFRPVCLELTGIPEASDLNTLKSTILKILERPKLRWIILMWKTAIGLAAKMITNE